jgi:tRNA threonylcarbamoyladenosine biosynthesis protein TsaB
MAFILSIETSTSICSVALHTDGELLAYKAAPINRSHAESLLPMIHHLLQDYAMQDLEGIAISEGPGSYTGLRIGAATAMGLCYALDIPLIAVNTLEALAWQVKPCNIHRAWCCPMIDARRMEVYCLLMNGEGNIVTEAHPHIVTEDSFQELLAAEEVWFFGDGAAKCKPLLAHHKHAIFVDGIRPSAQQVGTLAYTGFKNRQFVDINTFSPKYLKLFMSLH